MGWPKLDWDLDWDVLLWENTSPDWSGMFEGCSNDDWDSDLDLRELWDLYDSALAMIRRLRTIRNRRAASPKKRFSPALLERQAQVVKILNLANTVFLTEKALGAMGR